MNRTPSPASSDQATAGPPRMATASSVGSALTHTQSSASSSGEALPAVSAPSSAPQAYRGRPAKRGLAAGVGVVLFAAGVAAGVAVSRTLLPPSPPVASTRPDDDSVSDRDLDSIHFDADKQVAAGIETQVLTPEPFVARVWRSGRVALHNDRIAHICPPTEGIVREVRVALGQKVTAGAVLAVIDSRELGQAKLEAHKARIAREAEREVAARVRQTMANAEELLRLLAAEMPLSEIDRLLGDKPIGEWRQQLLGAYTRHKQLRSQLASQRASAGAIPESTILKTQADADAASAAYAALVDELKFQVKNQVRQAELKLKEVETAFDVARTKLLLLGLTPEEVEALDPIAEGAAASHLFIRAPFAGTILEKHAVRSERVGPDFQMFVLADLSSVWVQADVYEADLPLVRDRHDHPIVFRSPLAGIAERTARVIDAGHTVDKASRSITVTAEADNADGRLVPGLFVEVGFDSHDPTPTLQVPAAAVLRSENKPFVFVQESPERFRRTEVTPGRSTREKVEIIRGLKPGDRVVTRGAFVLKSELFKDQMVGE